MASSSRSSELSSLIYVDDSLPGITRRKSGKGWAYFDPKGNRIKDREEIDRLNSVALPPAYVDAWYCPAANGHILATGIDARGRKQYRYHPEFRSHQDGEKFDRCLAFGKALLLVRKQVAEDLADRTLSRERAIASVVRLLDLGRLRVGNESYAKRNKSFGATTLRNRHAEVKAGRLRLRFKGKSGQNREVVLTDRILAKTVREMHELPGQHLFRYVGDDGEPHSVSSSDVNEYLRDSMGEDFTAKDFRTFHGSVLAFTELVNAEGRVPIRALLEVVAAKLGNTPAVTRKSYIHPAVIALVDRQLSWRAALKYPRKTRWQSREERALIALLENSPSAAELLAA